MKTSRWIILSAALMAAPALAHGPHGGPCRTELQALHQKLCPNVTPGPGAWKSCPLCPERTPGPGGFSSCLQEAAAANGVTLSEPCLAHLTTMQDKMAAWKTACAPAVTNLCPNITPGPGKSGHRAIGKCLHENQSELTANYPACADLLAQHHGQHHHHHHDPTPTP